MIKLIRIVCTIGCRIIIQTMQNVVHIDIPYDELGVFKT